MKSKFILAIALTLIISSCNGQTKNEKNSPVSSNEPKTSFKVNKEYDKNGNLIKYDSTYSSYYSSESRNNELTDSTFNNFKRKFNKKFSHGNDPFFNNPLFQDSLLPDNFYKKDFFSKQFKDHMERMDSLVKEMDIFKNNFFGNQFDSPGELKVPHKKL